LDILEDLIKIRRTRLVTITGTAGLGKTRLAQALVERCQDSFKDGVAVVELSSLSNSTQLPHHLAIALDLTLSADSVNKQLSGYLSERNMLLLLDRFEHLLESAQFISQLIANAPEITFLITSQAPLRCAAECIYELPSLTQSAPDAASALFKKIAANHGVEIEGTSLDKIVVEICQRVNGNALAIELAAAQIQYLSLHEILKGLSDQPLKFLDNRLRDAEIRHRSLQDAIEWSYSLLPPELQRTFCILSVFAGPFSIDIAEQVVEAGQISKSALRKYIAELLDWHLLQKLDAGTGSLSPIAFQILDAPKLFGEEKLAQLAEHRLVRAAHANSMAAYADILLQLLRSGKTAEAVSSFVPKINDFRKALTFALEHITNGRPLDFLYKVQALLAAAGIYDEAQQWIERGLASAPSSDSSQLQSDLAWCYMALAMRHRQRLDSFASMRTLRTARYLAKKCSNLPLQIRIETIFANERIRQGKFSLAEYHAANALQIAKAVDDIAMRVMVKQLAGMVSSFQGDFANSQRYLLDALDDSVNSKNSFLIMLTLTGLSGLLLRMGNSNAALNNLRQISALAETASNVISAFANKVCEFLVHFEDQDLESAGTVLSNIESLSSNGENQKHVALICRFMMDLEIYKNGANMALRYWPASIGEVQGEYLYLRVDFLCARIVWAAELDYQAEIQRSFEEIERILQTSRNAFWFSRFCDAACQALTKKADAHSVHVLLGVSKSLIKHANIVSTKRQLGTWISLEEFLQRYSNQNTFSANSIGVVNMRFSVESRQERERFLLYIKSRLLTSAVARPAAAARAQETQGATAAVI
jgi:predicted ATPase